MPDTAKSGTVITDELADQLAAEAGYQLRPGRGRPSLAGHPDASPQVTFRLPTALRDRAQARAENEGKTVSAIAREALERYLAS